MHPEVNDWATLVQITNLLGGADGDAPQDNVSGEIGAPAEKAEPASGDLIPIEDSAASNAKKKARIGNLLGGEERGTVYTSLYASLPGVAPSAAIFGCLGTASMPCATAALFGYAGADLSDDVTCDVGVVLGELWRCCVGHNLPCH